MLWFWQVSPEVKKIATDLLDEDMWILTYNGPARAEFVRTDNTSTKLTVHGSGAVLINSVRLSRWADGRIIWHAAAERCRLFAEGEEIHALHAAAKDFY